MNQNTGLTWKQEVLHQVLKLAKDFLYVDSGLTSSEAMKIAALDFREEMKGQTADILKRLAYAGPCPSYVSDLETSIWSNNDFVSGPDDDTGDDDDTELA